MKKILITFIIIVFALTIPLMGKDTKDLFKAVKDGSLSDVNDALKSGANVNEKDKNGNTALVHAIKKGRVKAVGLLLNAGADEDVKTEKGQTMKELVKEKITKYKRIKKLLKKARKTK